MCCKIILLTILILLILSCNNESKKLNENNLIKNIYLNIDSLEKFKKNELNNKFIFKLFPNGDTNFIYFFKDNVATNFIAWDTSGIKTLENEIGEIKIYENNVLESKTIYNGKLGSSTFISFYKTGGIKNVYISKNYQPFEIIKLNETGDTVYYETP